MVAQTDVAATQTHAAIPSSTLPIPTITETPIPASDTPHTPLPEAEELLAQAFSYSQQGEDEKAIEYYTKAIEADPLYGQPYINRGSIYASSGDPEKGLANFNKGLELDPTNAAGYVNRAAANRTLGNLDEALSDVTSCLRFSDDEYTTLRALHTGGAIYDEKGETALALAAYSAALEIDELFEFTLLARGQVYLKQEDWLRAFQDLVLALELTEQADVQEIIFELLMGVYPEGTTYEDAMAASEEYSAQAIQYSESGNYESSIEAWAKAIEIDPLNSEFYYQRSIDLANSGNLDEAISDMSYSIALDPFNSRGYFWRGMMEANYSMYAGAITDLEKALEFELSSEAETQARQVLENMHKSMETCQFTEFEAMSDAKNPTFAFIFEGPPGEPFITSIFPYPDKDAEGTVSFAMIPEDGVVPAGAEYQLKDGETIPIELKIDVAYEGCHLRKIVTWPEIDILALLSEAESEQ